MRHGALEYHVACVFEIPVAEHSGEHRSFVLEIFCHDEVEWKQGVKVVKKNDSTKPIFRKMVVSF